jgi:hypothetical protein
MNPAAARPPGPVLILPSPLLPGSVYDGLAGAMADAGTRVSVAPAVLGPGETAHELVVRWSRLITPRTILVPHSNAGYLAPLARSHAAVRAPIVFVDAALPPAAGRTPLAPPQFRAFLAERAGPDGLLPPWTRWWPRHVIEPVVGAEGFAELDHDCPRLPLDYFDTIVDAPPGWMTGPNAYLAFGSTYADELERVRVMGWPHDAMDGGHLHFRKDPAVVAARVLSLAAATRVTPR